MGTAQGGIGSLSAIGCGGFNVPPQDPGCVIDPDNDMGWHIHCPQGTCPNIHCAAGTCPADLRFTTPTGGEMAFGGANSLHWGHHFSTSDRLKDTTKFRQMAAFVTNPINLALFTQEGDLELSFFHIASMESCSDPPVNCPEQYAFDFGDVQIQVDLDPDPAVDNWGFWDKLAPFENVYDHIPQIWSLFGTSLTYCEFTPTDTGTAPPAPRGVHETMCYPLGIWSNCGWQWDASTTMQCPGPGHPGQTGTGLWIESRFRLDNFLGQRVRIRWIAQSWEFDATASSYEEVSGWENSLFDDGWWVDDIRVTGVIETQLTPIADAAEETDPPGVCPATCDPAASGSDNGTLAVLALREANGDGVIERGERVTLDASASSLPGGCVGGVAQFRFLRDGQIVQDWSASNLYLDAPLRDAEYRVLVRCSADFQCTGTVGATAAAGVYTGDGADITLSVDHGPGGEAILSWTSRPQVTSVAGYDLFRGTFSNQNRDPGLATLACLEADIPQPASVGEIVTRQDADVPPVGVFVYYLVGHSSRAAGALDALGKRSDQTIRVAPVACP
jgi:hypothetical protein